MEAEAVQIAKSVTTCFRMRHKLYATIEEIMDKKLSGLIKLDPTYESINLKGTRPENMPRYSKKRGKNNSHKSIRGINHHDICLLAAVDEHDNMLLKIAGLGHESKEKLEPFTSCFDKGSTIISDDKSAIKNFVTDKHMKSDVIASRAVKKHHLSDSGNSLSSVNQLHQEIEILKYKKRGVSTRHLQGYLKWIIFTKKIRYRYEVRNRKSEAYMKMIGLNRTLISQDICKILMPINMYKAYGEYHYGIFKNGNPYPENMYSATGCLASEQIINH